MTHIVQIQILYNSSYLPEQQLLPTEHVIELWDFLVNTINSFMLSIEIQRFSPTFK